MRDRSGEAAGPGDAARPREIPRQHAGAGAGEYGADQEPLPTIRLLGPVGVRIEGRRVSLGPQQQALLAALALARGRPVSTSRLADLMWEGATPDGVITTLRTHVLHLRRVLEPGRRARSGFKVLVSSGGRSNTSYTLRVADEQVDALRFVRLTEEARRATADADPAAALALLDEALGLWAGPALEGVSGRSFALAEASRLEELRLVTREDRVDALIGLGRYEEVVAELSTLVRDFPLRERLRSQLILALYRSGRQADALAEYRDIHQHLRDNLGLEPGRPLQRLHQQVLNADPVLDPEQPRTAPSGAGAGAVHRPVPRQLPPDVASFTGRGAYLREMDALLPRDAHADGPGPGSAPGAGQTLVISSLSGMAGVGKTTLAVHWAHRVADRFPDGQLHVNLRGHAPEPPMQADEALGQLLRALGVAAEHLPESTDEKAALYRSLLADKRVLVLLDDAAGLEHVRPLLPGSPTCFVVVTSRNDLRGLTAFHDARRVSLALFSEEEALALLSRVIGTDRVREEADAASEVVRLCGCLPLAVRIIAAHLMGDRRRPLAEVVRDLREGDRLGELALEAEPRTAVRTVLDLSYQTLPEDERRLLRLLSLTPGPDVPARAAAALAELPEADTVRLLDRLVSRSLLEMHRTERFHLHELVRLFARERAGEEDAAEAREEAVRRLFTWYSATTESAAAALYGTFYYWYAEKPPEPGASPTAPLAFDSAAAALAWLDAERPVLLACVGHAAEHGPYPFAWQIALTLHGHLMAHGQRADWLRAAHAGLRAAEADEDDYGQAVMCWSLGYVLWELGRHDEALRHSNRADSLYERLDLGVERAGALLGLAASHREQGDLDAAARHARRSLRLYEEGAQPAGSAWALFFLGSVLFDQGRLTAAREEFRRAGEAGRRSQDEHSALLALWGLGATHHALGEFGEALRCLTEVLAADDRLLTTYAAEGALNSLALVYRDSGDPRLALKHGLDVLSTTHRTHRRLVEAEALNTIGTVLLRLDDLPGALDHHHRARELARTAGCRRAEAAAGLGLAAVHRSLGEHREALSHGRLALSRARQTGLGLAEGEALAELAAVHLALGQHHKAAETVERALRLHRDSGYRPGLTRALETAAEVHGARGDAEAAERHASESAELCARMGVPRQPGARFPAEAERP
ncbi:AfsR/SARP family transcriptional regulator [Streptomyces armeniacus]|uniref:AfsR/SARP family transcriptional regulator n=1 Tax=Streptomyces armeniacus TaxID=83291 RepID=UPI001AD7E570|nr:BTAD domain-containing putative transcriptional regulator [Streptomyces armeniacus]